ncbi:phosphatidylglycerophosphatase A [Amylibacter marinus]|uniref:Phosphatidylglycerophosphatase A n=2 Tax=Amylibacter marinus TaxID=1475483 RepID=A0ABQ5VST7_9RHOB|nr:phosphatidylglycerophosphatase A [Amylibacter marinus]
MPGTWGAIAALPFAFVMLWLGFGWIDLLIVTALVFGAGVWAIGRETVGVKDPDRPIYVIDEVAGMWIALLPIFWLNSSGMSFATTLESGSQWAGIYPLQISVALGLFRFFDVFKPWPLTLIQQRPTALGVMIDDFLAGVVTAATLFAMNFALFYLGLSIS